MEAQDAHAMTARKKRKTHQTYSDTCMYSMQHKHNGITEILEERAALEQFKINYEAFI